MAKRRRPSLFGTKCPECGSKHTKVNWMKPKNYKKAALTVVDPFLGMVAGRYERVCQGCGHKFTA